jgi:hypothetical protein
MIMDKRTSKGKTFEALGNEEKALFLLENIYFQLIDIKDEQRRVRIEIKRQQKFLALQADCLVFLVKTNNRTAQASEEYRKYIQNKLKSLVPNYNWI